MVITEKQLNRIIAESINDAMDGDETSRIASSMLSLLNKAEYYIEDAQGLGYNIGMEEDMDSLMSHLYEIKNTLQEILG